MITWLNEVLTVNSGVFGLGDEQRLPLDRAVAGLIGVFCIDVWGQAVMHPY